MQFPLFLWVVRIPEQRGVAVEHRVAGYPENLPVADGQRIVLAANRRPIVGENFAVRIVPGLRSGNRSVLSFLRTPTAGSC